MQHATNLACSLMLPLDPGYMHLLQALKNLEVASRSQRHHKPEYRQERCQI